MFLFEVNFSPSSNSTWPDWNFCHRSPEEVRPLGIIGDLFKDLTWILQFHRIVIGRGDSRDSPQCICFFQYPKSDCIYHFPIDLDSNGDTSGVFKFHQRREYDSRHNGGISDVPLRIIWFQVQSNIVFEGFKGDPQLDQPWCRKRRQSLPSRLWIIHKLLSYMLIRHGSTLPDQG